MFHYYFQIRTGELIGLENELINLVSSSNSSRHTLLFGYLAIPMQCADGLKRTYMFREEQQKNVNQVSN